MVGEKKAGVLEEIRRVFNRKEALKSIDLEQAQRKNREILSDVFQDLMRRSTVKEVQPPTQIHSISFNSLFFYFKSKTNIMLFD